MRDPATPNYAALTASQRNSVWKQQLRRLRTITAAGGGAAAVQELAAIVHTWNNGLGWPDHWSDYERTVNDALDYPNQVFVDDF